jgi:hypothetical protein
MIFNFAEVMVLAAIGGEDLEWLRGIDWADDDDDE